MCRCYGRHVVHCPVEKLPYQETLLIFSCPEVFLVSNDFSQKMMNPPPIHLSSPDCSCISSISQKCPAGRLQESKQEGKRLLFPWLVHLFSFGVHSLHMILSTKTIKNSKFVCKIGEMHLTCCLMLFPSKDTVMVGLSPFQSIRLLHPASTKTCFHLLPYDHQQNHWVHRRQPQ